MTFAEKHLLECAEEELKGPFKKLKLEIVRQSFPALFACGAVEALREDPPKFERSVVSMTNYDVKGFFLPNFIVIAIISGVIKWLVMRWLDRHFRGYF